MTDQIRQQMTDQVSDFRLPHYSEIPDFGLFLEQVTRYINACLTGIGCAELTPSMVSNYVKQKTVPGPEKKAYGADSIAYLIFVSIVKNVISMEDIRMLRDVQQRSYELSEAYDYFCDEFENLLQAAFGIKDAPDRVGQTDSPEKELLRMALVTVTHKIYLDCYLQRLRESMETPQGEEKNQ